MRDMKREKVRLLDSEFNERGSFRADELADSYSFFTTLLQPVAQWLFKLETDGSPIWMRTTDGRVHPVQRVDCELIGDRCKWRVASTDGKKSAGATHPEDQRIPLTKGMNHIIEGGTVEVYSPDGELYARYECGPVERETTWPLVVPDNGYYAVQV